MDNFPSCNPDNDWPYFANESLESEASQELQLPDPFDQLTATSSTFSGSNATYSPSCLLPLDHNPGARSRSAANNSQFEPNISANYPSTATWGQPLVSSAAGDRDWSYSQQLPTSNVYDFNHGTTSRALSFSTDHALSPDESAGAAYKNWQSTAHTYELNAGDQASYASILEELNQMDASMLVDSAVSCTNPLDVHSYPPHASKRTRPQSMDSRSYSSTSLSPVIEATLLPSPVSNDNTSPPATKPTISNKKLSFKKSSIKAKIPHSAVEKRYRSNLNSKMIELQQCVPGLHFKSNSEEEAGSWDSTTASPKQDGKLAKGLILESAADYIRTLEARTSELDTHVELLERRLAVLQRIALDKTRGADSGLVAVDRTDKRSPQARRSPSISKPEASATGRVSKSPNAISRQTTIDPDPKTLLSKVEEEQSHDFETGSVSPPAKRRRVSRNKIAKVAVGSLLGLALWEGYSEAELSASAQNSRGLFAIPAEFLTLAVRHLSVAVRGPDAQLHHYIFGHFWPLIKILLLVVVVTYALTPAVLAILHYADWENEKAVAVASLPTTALPLTVAFCRDAWATAVPKIRVPDHGIMREAAALVLKTWRLLLRSILGWPSYSYLTGETLESEIARVKNWDIALDAQLAGGDSHVCTRRLLLTFLASMTLRNTPLRLMRKSLHVQLILWNYSSARLGRRLGIASIAKGLADHFWQKARTLQKSMPNAAPHSNDTAELLAVPGHRFSLLNQAAHAVFADSIVIRIAHVARNEPWKCPNLSADEGMDAVFNDVAIRSPLDALAALFSGLILRNALLGTLESGSEGYSIRRTEEALHLALATAPPGSRAGIRARAAQAVFFKADRVASITAALKEMPKHHDINTAAFHFTEPSFSSICTTNVRIALRSAALIIGACGQDTSPLALHQSTLSALLGIIERMLQASDVTILGFATAYRSAKVCHANLQPSDTAGPELKSLTRRLQLIVASEWSSKYGVNRDVIMFYDKS